MSNQTKARVINVILVEQRDEQAYFTLSGQPIGRIVGGTLTQDEPTPEPVKKVGGGVVKSPTVAQTRLQKKKAAEEDLTLENRITYEKEHNT